MVPDTIGQLTQLEDSDGRSIYEGDIVKLGPEVVNKVVAD